MATPGCEFDAGREQRLGKPDRHGEDQSEGREFLSKGLEVTRKLNHSPIQFAELGRLWDPNQLLHSSAPRGVVVELSVLPL